SRSATILTVGLASRRNPQPEGIEMRRYNVWASFNFDIDLPEGTESIDPEALSDTIRAQIPDVASGRLVINDAFQIEAFDPDTHETIVNRPGLDGAAPD